jgi:hypothetical protein
MAIFLYPFLVALSCDLNHSKLVGHVAGQMGGQPKQYLILFKGLRLHPCRC